MNEDNNQEPEESKLNKAVDTYKKVDNGVRDAKRAVEGGKKVISFIAKFWKPILIILIILLVLVILCALEDVLNGNTADNFTEDGSEDAKIYMIAKEKVSYPAKLSNRTSVKFDIKKAISISEDGKNYTIDEEYIKETLFEMEKKDAIDLTMFELTEEGGYELFKKYIEANIKTMYPSIGSTPIDGKIKIQRDTEIRDKNTGVITQQIKDLTYMPYNELKELIENKNLAALNYFSINMADPYDPTLYYATSSVTHYYDINGKHTSSEVNSITPIEEKYKYLVEPYSMPFDFLIILHIWAKEKVFMESVVELLDQYEATITLKDTVTTTTTTIDYSGTWYQVIKEKLDYTKKIKKVRTVEVVGATDVVPIEEVYYEYEYGLSKTTEEKDSKEISNSNIKEYYDVDTSKIKSVNETIVTEKALTYVNSWIAKTENIYTKGKTDEIEISNSTIDINTPEGETQIKYDGKSYIQVDNNEITDNIRNKIGQQLKDFINSEENSKVSIIYNKLTKTIYERKEIKEQTILTESRTEYSEQNTDTSYNLDNEKGFINLLKNTKYAWNSLYTADIRFFEELNSRQSTQDLEQVMRYVFYKITNSEDYGVTDLNSLTQMFDTSNYNDFSGGDILKIAGEFITYFEGTGEIVEQNGKKYYKTYWDSYGKVATVGKGLTFKYKSKYFKNYGINSLEVGDLIEVEVADAIKEDIIKDDLTSLQRNNPGLKSYQYIALLSAKYNVPILTDKFKNNYKNHWKEEYDKYGKEIPNVAAVIKKLTNKTSDSECERINNELKNVVNCDFYTNYWADYCHSKGVAAPGLVKRRCYEWILFQYGYDLTTNKYISENITSSGDTANVAEYAMSYLGKTYQQVFNKKPYTEWCQMFADKCLRDCGYGSVLDSIGYSSTNCSPNVKKLRQLGKFKESKRNGGNYIPKPGDIIYFWWGKSKNVSDHVAIVTYCDGKNIKTVDGNKGGTGTYYGNTKVGVRENLTVNSNVIVGYFSLE